MYNDEKGPCEFWRSGTARDPSRDRPKSVNSDDSELAIAAQDSAMGHDEISGDCPLDRTGSPSPTVVYDSGWTTQHGFLVRVQWHGVPDYGHHQQFFRTSCRGRPSLPTKTDRPPMPPRVLQARSAGCQVLGEPSGAHDEKCDLCPSHNYSGRAGQGD